MRTPSRLRVLLIAEACHPTGFETKPVGYHLARALASRDDLEVTIATHPQNRGALDQDVLKQISHLVYPGSGRVSRGVFAARPFLQVGNRRVPFRSARTALGHLLFERELYQLLGHELQRGNFDLIHRVTPGSANVASPMASWCDVPFVVGPLTGRLPWPREYPEFHMRENQFLAPLRKFSTLLPYYRSTYHRAAAVIAGSHYASKMMPSCCDGRTHLISQDGLDSEKCSPAGWKSPTDRFRFVTLGGLEDYEGLWLTLTAIRDSVTLRDCELVVVGDGPQRDEVEQMVRKFRLNGQVRFTGDLSQSDTDQELAQAQCFVLPSLHERDGHRVLQAMAHAMPSIVVNYGGPRDVLDPKCGVLLPMQRQEELTADLRTAMEALVHDPVRCQEFGRHAVERVRRHFTWPAKAEQVFRVYRDVLGMVPVEVDEPIEVLAFA